MKRTPCPHCGGARVWSHDHYLSVTGKTRVRLRCAGCGRRFTVAGATRNVAVEEERRIEFFSLLASHFPELGIARARDVAAAGSGVSPATASRLIRAARIKEEYQLQKYAPERYLVLEAAMRHYSAYSLKRPEPTALGMDQVPVNLDLVDREQIWDYLLYVRGIAALVRGRSSGRSGLIEDFPSWIDIGAPKGDERQYYPPSLVSCARSAENEVALHVIRHTPASWWRSQESWRWLYRWGLRTDEDGERPAGCPLEIPNWAIHENNVTDDREVLSGIRLESVPANQLEYALQSDPPPVPEPSVVKHLIKNEYLRASRMRSLAMTAPDADATLRYWVRLHSADWGSGLCVFITEANRMLAHLTPLMFPEQARLLDGAAELKRIETDWQSGTVTFLLGGKPWVLRPA